MMKTMKVNQSNCSGCKLCMMECSFRHFKISAPHLSNVRIMGRETRAAFVPALCVQCPERSCIDACPEGALSIVESTGAIQVDHAVCILCGSCVIACAFDGIFIGLNPEGEEFLMVCDLCDGEPQCAKNCRLDALVYA